MTAVSAFCAALLLFASKPEPVNPHAKVTAEFEAKVDQYIKLRDQAASKTPPLNAGAKPADIAHHEQALADQIRTLRAGAKQGALFTPDVTVEFRRLIHIAATGPRKQDKIRRSLAHAEPVRVNLTVNGPYPENIPVQSMPPAVLSNLPRLPKELEYRVNGPDLILRDIGANLIVDIAPGVLPPAVNPRIEK